MSFYTDALAKELRLTPSSAYDELVRFRWVSEVARVYEGGPFPTVEAFIGHQVDLACEYALSEIKDMGRAARVLTERKLDRVLDHLVAARLLVTIDDWA